MEKYVKTFGEFVNEDLSMSRNDKKVIEKIKKYAIAFNEWEKTIVDSFDIDDMPKLNDYVTEEELKKYSLKWKNA